MTEKKPGEPDEEREAFENMTKALVAVARREGAREALERAARLLEQPAMVFAFEAESIREDVIKRIRALADQPEVEGRKPE